MIFAIDEYGTGIELELNSRVIDLLNNCDGVVCSCDEVAAVGRRICLEAYSNTFV